MEDFRLIKEKIENMLQTSTEPDDTAKPEAEAVAEDKELKTRLESFFKGAGVELTEIEPKAAVSSNKEPQTIREKQAAMYKEYQENIRKSEKLQIEILKGTKQGLSTTCLLLKAAEAIGLMTGNTVFYKQIKEDLIKTYGEIFLSGEALSLEAEEVRARLEKLYQAKEEAGIEERVRLQQTIREHEALLESIEGKLKTA